MRTARTINRNWKFCYCPELEPRAELVLPEFSDASWHALSLPHTWMTYETTGNIHPFIRDASETDDPFWWQGWGTYRKRFFIDERLRGKRIRLEFDAVQKFCRVYCNGVPVGEHAGGFTSFAVDATDAVRFGAENLLAVSVSNRRDDPGCIPPMTAGNWNLYGGICRDVRLVVTSAVHIPFQGSADAEGGTRVTTPHVSPSEGTVRVRTHLLNTLSRAVEGTVQTSVEDPEGTVVASVCTPYAAGPREAVHADADLGAVRNPRLWSPETPSLYAVHTVVRAEGDTVDSCRSPLGFRFFHWDYDERRLWLNGSPVHIRGTNRHQEYPWLGDAVPKWIHERELREIRYDLNHNFARWCHYPQDPLVYDFCDRHGIIVCEEVPNIKNLPFNDAVRHRNVVEMIRRDRNHPSILFWSMGNETDCAADPEWARAEDPTRIVHVRHVRGLGETEPHSDRQIDMENLLCCTVRGWYGPEDRDTGEPESGQHTGDEERQHRWARLDDAAVRGRIDRNNTVAWLYADHGADREYRDCPLKHVNPKGWVDMYRVPKAMYYLWQAAYGTVPMVRLHRNNWRLRHLGRDRDIVVDSNCPEVELFVNGRSQGVRHPLREPFPTVVYAGVRVERGVLEVEGRGPEGVVRDRIVLAGKPFRLVLTSSHDRLVADRAGIAIVTADITDADGNPVCGANHPIRWSVEGPAGPVAPSVYRSDRGKHEAREGVWYIDTPVRIPIRTTAEAGIIRVRAESPGLEPGTVTMRSVLPSPVSAADGIREVDVFDGGRTVTPPGPPPA